MEVIEVLDKKIIKTHLDAKSKDEVFKELAKVLKDEKYVNNTEDFVKDLYVREAEGKTGLGNYVAIPHSRSASVDKIGVAIATLDEPIEWESLDNKGVKVVIMFAVNADTEGATAHLRLLSMFARKLAHVEVSEKLIKAQTAEDVVEAFR